MSPGCGKETTQQISDQFRPGGILRIAAQSPQSLDPIHSRNYWESEIVLQIFDGLLRFDAQLNLTPALAHDWQVSPDGRTYTFHLRKGVRFHNGRELVADDIVYSLTRLLDPKWRSEDAAHFARIQGAAEFRTGRALAVSGLKTLDNHTLEITLDQPYAPFLRVLTQQPASAVPREQIEKGADLFAQKPIGTGPFRFERWESASEIVLAANPDYFDGRPFLDEIRITTMPALNSRDCFQLFREQKLDLSFVPPDQALAAQKEADWIFLSRPVLRLMYLGMNMRDRWLRKLEIRKAIAFAVNRTELLGDDFDYSQTHGLIPFSLLGANPGSQTDSPNPQEATRGVETRRKKQPVKLQLWHAHVSESRNALLSRLATQLSAAGFSVELKIVPSMSDLLGRIYSGKTQLFLLGEQMDFPDPDALLNRLFHSRSPGNPFGYSNEKVDELLAEAQTTLDDGRRARLYREIESLILDDCPILPLALVRYSLVYHRRVRGLEVSPLGFQYLPLRGIWLQTETSQ